MKSKVQKWGNSLAVRLPKALADEVQFEQGLEVDLIVEEDRLVIKKKKPSQRYSLEDLVAQFPLEHTPDEDPWGEPMGKEIW